MNKLSKGEFQDRIEAVSRARNIFINLTEGNITSAFILYQSILAETERTEALSTLNSGNRIPSPLDKYERPKCPECGGPLMFRILQENPAGINTQLVCEHPMCDTVLNSDKDIIWWEEELRKEQNDRREQATPEQ
jgi:hypothetical protein